MCDVQLTSVVDSDRSSPTVSVAVRPGFACKASIPGPLPPLSNGQPLPTSVSLQLVDSCGFPASLARSSVVELSQSSLANVMGSIESDLKSAGGVAVPLRLPVVNVVADVPTVTTPGRPGVTQRRVHLGEIPVEKVESAFSISVRESMFKLAEPLPLQRLELTAPEWDGVRAQGGVPALLVVTIVTLTLSPSRDGRKVSRNWVELPDSCCEFPFRIRPSAVPAVEVRYCGEPVPLVDAQGAGGGASSKLWQPITALPGHAVDDVQILLQGEDGRPVDLAAGGWEVDVLPPPPNVQQQAREQHIQHSAERNRIHIEQTSNGSPPDVAIDPNVPVGVPEFLPVVAKPDPQRPGVVIVSGMHAPFLVAKGPWEYQLEMRSTDGSSAAMVGGGKGIIPVAAVPGPPVQWGISVHSTVPTQKDEPVAISGESSLCLDMWLQDFAGNPTMTPFPEESRPLVFTQAVQPPPADVEYDESQLLKVQLYVQPEDTPAASNLSFHTAVTFNVMDLGENLSWCASSWLLLNCCQVQRLTGAARGSSRRRAH